MRDKQFYKEQTGDNRFYVYIHRRATDNKPFYVGKGQRLRAWCTDRNNRFWQAVRKKHGFVVDIVFDDLLEHDAFQCEKDTILELEYFGYELTNQTRGGDGPSGYIYSDESKAKMSESQKSSEKAKQARLESARKRTGIKTGPQISISRALKGKPKSKEHSLAVSESLKDKSTYVFVRVSDEFVLVGTRGKLAEDYGICRKTISSLFQKRKTLVAAGWTLSETSSQEDVDNALRKARDAKVVSKETRAKMSESRKTFLVDNPELMVRELMKSDKIPYKSDTEVYVFINIDTEELFQGTRKELAAYLNITTSHVGRLFSPKNTQKTVRGWSLKIADIEN